MSEDGVRLNGVVQRFQEAEDTLEKLTERLRSLTLAEEWASKGAAAFETSSLSLAASATTLDGIISELRATLPELRGALSATATTLAATDLGRLVAAIEETSAASATTAARVDEFEGTLKDLQNKIAVADGLRDDVYAAKSEAQKATDALAAVNKKYEELLAKVPERNRKKWGI